MINELGPIQIYLILVTTVSVVLLLLYYYFNKDNFTMKFNKPTKDNQLKRVLKTSMFKQRVVQDKTKYTRKGKESFKNSQGNT